MKSESHIRQSQIEEAAIRRFSHFGIAKTTLTEVADDLSVSKQALAYYFPDKQSLVTAVIARLTSEYLDRLKAEMEEAPGVDAALRQLIEVKSFFFEKYFMLLIQAEHLELLRHQAFPAWKQELTAREQSILAALLEEGVRRGELKPLEAEKTAGLLLQTLYAFSRCVKDQGDLPGREAFRSVLASQQEVIALFYQGLKCASWKS